MWRELERELNSTDIACSWLWTETWLGHYKDQVDYCFAVGKLGGKIVGIALVTVAKSVLRFRGTVHIGTAGEARGHSVDVENNRLLVTPALRTKFALSLISAIRQEFRPFAIHLDKFLPADLAAMNDAQPGLTVTDHACPVFDFSRVGQEYPDVLSAMGSGVRGRIRRSNRGFGALSGEWATTIDHALDIFDELQVLHQRRWEREGRRGAFASTNFAGFHREFITRSMTDPLRVMLFRLRHGDVTIGCLYGFIENGTVLFYQSGFVDVEDNHLKPGLSTHAACMQQCFDRGLRSYNFLAGEARYKRELANSELLLQSGIAFRYRGTTVLLEQIQRLGLVDRARAVKRWRERRSVVRA